LRGHVPANHRPDKHAIVSWVFLPRKVKVVHSSDGGGLAGVGVPNKNRFGHAVQVSTPRVHCCTFSSIGRAIWFLALVANRATSIPEPRLPDTRTTLRRPRQSLAGGASGTPNQRRVRTNQHVSVPITCFHVIPVHIERGIRVPFPSRAISSDNRVPSSSCRRHLQLLWWPCIPGGRKDGIPNRRVSARSRFCPSRTQRPLLLSVRIHHVLSPVVKALSTT
jgi:hypothetical protein